MSRRLDAVHVGLDVARDELVGHVRPLEQEFVFPNTAAGCRALVAALRRLRPQRIVLEPTGGYERAAFTALRASGFAVYLVNPQKARAFAESTRGLAKTDRLDAAALAHYAEVWQPPAPIARDPTAERLAEHLAWRDHLVSERNRLANHASHLRDPDLRRRSRAALARLNAAVALATTELRRIVLGHERLARLWRRLRTAPGIGELSAFALIARLPELGLLDGKRIASLVGVAPYPWDSGRLKGRRIIQGGRFRLRKSLYMAVLAATRKDGPLRTFFLSLQRRGKPAKLALMAALRKLLCRLNAMIRDNRDWCDQTVKAS